MSDPTCTCLIRGCQGEAPEGCWFCAACFDQYAKHDPRMGRTHEGGLAPNGPVFRAVVSAVVEKMLRGGTGTITLTVASNQAPDDIAGKVVQKLADKRRFRTTSAGVPNWGTLPEPDRVDTVSDSEPAA